MTSFHQAQVSLSARNSKLSVLSMTHQEVKRDVSACRETITPGALPAVLHPKNSYRIRFKIDALPRRRRCVVWLEFLPLGATLTWSRMVPLALRVGEICWPGVSAQKHATQLAQFYQKNNFVRPILWSRLTKTVNFIHFLASKNSNFESIALYHIWLIKFAIRRCTKRRLWGASQRICAIKWYLIHSLQMFFAYR